MDHKVEITRSDGVLIDRWKARIDWPYGQTQWAFTRWGIYRKVRRELGLMDQPPETYFVPKGGA